MSVVRRQRALGAVIGSAVGDALGGPFEFGSAGEYRRRYPRPVLGGTGEMQGGGPFGWAPGEFTDDTQMAIVQAQSLLDRGGVDGADLFERFREWSASATDVGAQTASVLGSGLDWDRAAAAHHERAPAQSAGNGALMRATPAAVHFASADAEETLAAARALAGVTHGDPAAQWGAALYHRMVQAALDGDDMFATLAAALRELPDDQARYVEMLAPDWTPERTTLTNGTVWTCLAQAVWAVRRHESFDDAVIAAIELGGDTDTVAAVTGGLAGARAGIQAIPSRWTTYLHGSVPGHGRAFTLADLQELTLALLGETPPPFAALGVAAGPTAILGRLHVANLAGAAGVERDWAVVSLCRTGERFDRHPHRRAVYLVDQEGEHNAALGPVLQDVLDTIDAFIADGVPVVVHCHAGASRTGFVVRGWLMRAHGWDEPTATAHLADRWPLLDLHNRTFTDHLRTAELSARPDPGGS